MEKQLENLEIEAYHLYLKTNSNLKQMLKESNILHIDIKLFLKLVCSYIEKNKSKSDYAILFQKLENCETYQEVIDAIEISGLTLDYLKLNLASYINYYRPDMLYYCERYNLLYNKIKMYETYLNRKNHNPDRINDSYYKQAVQCFIKSNYTLEKFLFVYRILKKEFTPYLQRVKMIDPDLYAEYERTNNYRENTKKEFIKKDVINILNRIKELGADFNSIDFFTLTNFGIEEIIHTADETITSIEDLKLFRFKVGKLRKLKIYSETRIQQLYEHNYTYCINGELIKPTPEDIQNVINFLEENDIPISDITFDDAIKNYFKDLLINTKKR